MRAPLPLCCGMRGESRRGLPPGTSLRGAVLFERDAADHGGAAELFAQAVDRALGGGAAAAVLIDENREDRLPLRRRAR